MPRTRVRDLNPGDRFLLTGQPSVRLHVDLYATIDEDENVLIGDVFEDSPSDHFPARDAQVIADLVQAPEATWKGWPEAQIW